MKQPLITVLVVTYNHVNTFEAAIKSVLSQKTNFDFKIWVLDDASTDGTSDLVRKYAKMYPKKIIAKIREQNLGGIQNVFQALKEIDTKYYATLESDDYWCDDNKLQTQVDILENNPDCSFCCHNSYRRYPSNESNPNHNAPYIRIQAKSGKYKFPKKICRKQYIDPHYSSRVYRTDCLHLDKVTNPVMVCFDLASMFWFLSFGDMYYDNKIMSVYNHSYSGVYSGVDWHTKICISANIINQINQAFDYKYNSMFLNFMKRKSFPVSFLNTLKIKYFTKKQDLKQKYDELINEYQKSNTIRLNSKILARIAFPIGKSKKIAFEIKREKEV